MLIVLIINGILLLQGGNVWPAIGQSVGILTLVGVSLFLYQRIWLEIQRRRVLREISDTLTDRGSSSEFLDQIVRASLQLFPLSDQCAIHLLDETGQTLHLRFLLGATDRGPGAAPGQSGHRQRVSCENSSPA